MGPQAVPHDVWASPLVPAVGPTTASVLEHIKDDLKALVCDSWRREMRELSVGLRREVCQELHRCFSDALGLSSASRPCSAANQRPATSPVMSKFAPDRWLQDGHEFHDASASNGCGDVGYTSHLRHGSIGPEVPKTAKVANWVDKEEGSSATRLEFDAFGAGAPFGAPPPFNVPAHPTAEPAVMKVSHALETPSTGAKLETTPLEVRPISKESTDSDWSAPSSAASSDRKVRNSQHRMQVSTRFRASRCMKRMQKANRRTAKPGGMTATTRFSQAMEAELDNLNLTKEIMKKRWSVVRLVSNPTFDYFIFSVLAANALIIGLQVDELAASPGQQHVSTPYKVFNSCFTVFFTGELCIRLVAWGSKFFHTDEYLWNCFDVFVVFFSLIDEVAQLCLQGTSFYEIIDRMGVVRLLRVGRLARVVRMVRIIPTLKSMVYLIMASMPSFVWTVVLMIMLMFCIAVYFTEVATELLSLGLGEDRLESTWGSVGNSILSLWCAITGGDDWRTLTDTFGDNQFSTVNLVLFSVYISFAVLVMLNLVTGVFVEGMQRIIRDDKERELVKTAVCVFDEADIDHNQDLDEVEFQDIIYGAALDDYFFQLGIQANEASQLFHVLDTDHSGTLTLAEFVYGCVRLSAPSRMVDVALSERSLKMAIEDVRTEVAKLTKQVRAVLEKVAGSTSPRHGSAHYHGGHGGRLPTTGENQSVFLHQRYLYEWELGITEDA